MNFAKTHVFDVANLNNQPTSTKLIIAAAGATVVAVGAFVTKKSGKKSTDTPAA